MRDRIDRRAMALLSTGHASVDFSGGALPALLPFLRAEFGLSYTLVAVLMLASALSSSIVQPLFGLWSDVRGAVWLLPAGVAIGGIGMALASDAPEYWLVVLLVVVSGLGTAAYHPEGSKFAAYTSGRKRASGMSLFSVGGNLGYGLGALVLTPIIVCARAARRPAARRARARRRGTPARRRPATCSAFVPDGEIGRRVARGGERSSARWRSCSP